MSFLSCYLIQEIKTKTKWDELRPMEKLCALVNVIQFIKQDNSAAREELIVSSET